MLDIRRHLDEGVPRKVLATQAGIGLRSAYTWGARFNRVGHRITCEPRTGSSPGAGYEKVLVAVDDATRLAIAEVWAGEKGSTTMDILSRVVAWLIGQGIEC